MNNKSFMAGDIVSLKSIPTVKLLVVRSDDLSTYVRYIPDGYTYSQLKYDAVFYKISNTLLDVVSLVSFKQDDKVFNSLRGSIEQVVWVSISRGATDIKLKNSNKLIHYVLAQYCIPYDVYVMNSKLVTALDSDEDMINIIDESQNDKFLSSVRSENYKYPKPPQQLSLLSVEDKYQPMHFDLNYESKVGNLQTGRFSCSRPNSKAPLSTFSSILSNTLNNTKTDDLVMICHEKGFNVTMLAMPLYDDETDLRKGEQLMKCSAVLELWQSKAYATINKNLDTQRKELLSSDKVVIALNGVLESFNTKAIEAGKKDISLDTLSYASGKTVSIVVKLIEDTGLESKLIAEKVSEVKAFLNACNSYEQEIEVLTKTGIVDGSYNILEYKMSARKEI